MAYKIQLPPRLSSIHNVFHVSQLKKCIRVHTEVVDQQEVWVEPDLSYIAHPLKILDQKERGTRRKTIIMYKIQWNLHTEEEATWETESYLNQHYPGFLEAHQGIQSTLPYLKFSESRDEILLRGEGCDTLCHYGSLSGQLITKP